MTSILGWRLGLLAAALARAARRWPTTSRPTYEEDGKWMTAEDVPTFKVEEDGTVDWYTFSGFRRYHSECHVCHGPDGQGSSYAPAIAKSAVNMDYYDFTDVVVNGRKNGNSVMPSFGTNLQRDVLPRRHLRLPQGGRHRRRSRAGGRPSSADKPAAYAEAEDACMG